MLGRSVCEAFGAVKPATMQRPQPPNCHQLGWLVQPQDSLAAEAEQHMLCMAPHQFTMAEHALGLDTGGRHEFPSKRLGRYTLLSPLHTP